MDMCRVRVVAGRSTVDLALPAEVPLVDLLPELVDLVDGAGSDDDGRDPWDRPWQLVHPVRGALPPEGSLALAGIVDGATLILDSDPPPPPVLVEDVAEAVGETLAGHAGGPGRTLARWMGACLFGAAATALVAGGPPDASSATLAAVVAAFSSVLGAILGRLPDVRQSGPALAAAAVPWWAAAAAGFAAGDRPSLEMGAFAAAGVAAGALVAMATPGTRQVAPGVIVGGAAVAVELGFFAWSGHSDAPPAAAAVMAVVVALALLPRIVIGASGLTLAGDGAIHDVDLNRRLLTGRALQSWAQGGLLAGLAPAVAALAADDRPATLMLVVVLAGLLAVRARRAQRSAESIPLAVGAGLAALAAALSVAGFHPGTGQGLAAAGLAGAGAAVLAATLAGARPRPVTHKLLDGAEPFLVSALVVAALASGGAFAAVASLGD
jgi:type VII secretion integral membrane protein EccD